MNNKTRRHLLDAAGRFEFRPVLKANGDDRYAKLLTLEHDRFPRLLFIDRKAGMSESGMPAYFKIALHPDYYSKALESMSTGISAAINVRTGVNLFSHSGFADCPHWEGYGEPVARAYKAQTLEAVARIFQGLSATAGEALTSRAQARGSDDTAMGRQSGASNFLTVTTRAALPARGLVIAEPWIGLILAGQKVWEMRSSSCRIRGPIALIRKGSGLIVGLAELSDVRGPLSRGELEGARHRHGITPDRLSDDEWMGKWHYAWVLEQVQMLSEPIPYTHPSGAVIWVNLDHKSLKAADPGSLMAMRERAGVSSAAD